jgi:hypothetical protein
MKKRKKITTVITIHGEDVYPKILNLCFQVDADRKQEVEAWE